MLLLPKQAHSDSFQLFILVLNLAWLLSFGGNKFALAIYVDSPNLQSYYGPDPDHPGGAAVSDYPTDDVIRNNFQPTTVGQTLVMLISHYYLPSYEVICNKEWLKCAQDAFPMGFLTLRSETWWRDFYVRTNDVYLDGAVGVAYILVDNPRQRPSCGYFDVMVNRLQNNEKVYGIILVSAYFVVSDERDPGWRPTPDFNDQVLYWLRRDEDDRNEETRGNRPGGGGGWTVNRIMGAAAPFLAPVILGGAAGAFGSTVDTSGVLGNLKSTNPQGLPSFFGNGKDQDSGAKIDPTWTDFLPSSPMASVPSVDGNTVGTNEKLSLADATTPFEPQTDGKSSGTESASRSTSAFDNSGLKISDTFNADDPTTYQATLDGTSLIQRRRWRALLPRDSTDCYFPDSPDLLGKAVVTSPNPVPPNPVTPPVLKPDDNIEKLFVSEEVATLAITQHVNPSKLDIRVSTAQAEILNQQGINAPVGQEIPVPITWKITTLNSNVLTAPFSWPLYITVKSTDQNVKDSIQIKYGASLVLKLFSPVELGTEFDSSDTGKCSVGDWTGSSRQIQCAIDVGH